MAYHKYHYYNLLKDNHNKNKPPLEYIELQHNNLNYEFIQYISNVLSTHITLTSLDIAYNNIGDDGASILSIVLQTNTSINSLNLCSNNIGNNGAQALSVPLQTNKTLITLQLQHNNITSEGAIALANVIKNNTTLNKLYFSDNDIGVEGAQAFCDALESNTTLILLSIKNFGIELERAREQWLKRNNTLYNQQFWSPYIHYSIENDYIYGFNIANCNEIIMSSLICGTEVDYQIPMVIWRQIFSFWQRKNFIPLIKLNF